MRRRDMDWVKIVLVVVAAAVTEILKDVTKDD